MQNTVCQCRINDIGLTRDIQFFLELFIGGGGGGGVVDYTLFAKEIDKVKPEFLTCGSFS